jgi:hypothetical protein
VSQQLEAYASQLLDIIQRIQMQRGTGVLRARRGNDITGEEGEITFGKGQVTDAHTGRRTGSEAVNWMSSWGNCWFSYLSNDPALPPEKLLYTTGGPPERQSARSPDMPQRDVATPPPARGSFQPLADEQVISPLRKPRQSSLNNNLMGNASVSRGMNTPIPPASSSIETVTPIVGMRLDMALSVLDTARLTRLHRQVVLLIDGKRRVADLARLTQRQPEEVYKLLQDLERIHLINL